MNFVSLVVLKTLPKLRVFLIGLTVCGVVLLGAIKSTSSGGAADMGDPSEPNTPTQATQEQTAAPVVPSAEKQELAIPAAEEQASDEGVIDQYIEDVSLSDENKEVIPVVNVDMTLAPIIDVPVIDIPEVDVSEGYASKVVMTSFAGESKPVLWNVPVIDVPSMEIDLPEIIAEPVKIMDVPLVEKEAAGEPDEEIWLRFDKPKSIDITTTKWPEMEEIIQSLKCEEENTKDEPTKSSVREEAIRESLTDKELERIAIIGEDGKTVDMMTFQPTTDVDIRDRLSEIEDVISQWSKGEQTTYKQK